MDKNRDANDKLSWEVLNPSKDRAGGILATWTRQRLKSVQAVHASGASLGDLLGRQVANRFDVVTIWIKDERPIIIRMIMRAQSWWPVISSPGRERFGVKRVHGFSILAGESDMGARLRLASKTDPEEGFPVGSVARKGSALGI